MNCIVCQKQFIPSKGFKNVCSFSCKGKRTHILHPNLAAAKEDKICLWCQLTFNCVKHERRKFCSQSCSAKFNNSIRSKESRQKQKDSLMKTLKVKFPTNEEPIIAGPYTKIFIRTCAYTGNLFCSPTIYRKYSDEAIYISKKIYGLRAKFRFNVYDYPNHFNIKLLNQYGWYHPLSNPSGLSRDHLFSIIDGFLQKIDPRILAHPANCNLQFHIDNQKKNIHSSISLDELRFRIQSLKF